MVIETKKQALEASFTSAKTKNPCSHPSLDQAKKQALELAENDPDKLTALKQLLEIIYNVNNPLSLP